MKINKLESLLKANEYPGRGIVAGLSDDGKYAVSAYWTMGRSAGSRNRVFVTDTENGTEVVRTKAFDESLIAGDPSLIIYAAVRQLGNKTIVTNGDQTDTIFDGLKKGESFEQSLRSRKYEHDAPNFTPRISSLLNIAVKGERVDVAKALLDAAGMKNMLFGTAEFDTDISLKGSTYEEQMKSLKGNVNFLIRDGQFGPFGKLENLILAENIRESAFFQSFIGNMLSGLLTIDTTHFSELKGALSFEEIGRAHV